MAARTRKACRPWWCLREITHRVDEAERGGGVARVELAGDNGAGPSADARENRDVLLAIRSQVRDGLTHDAGAGLVPPEWFSRARVNGLEPAVHRAGCVGTPRDLAAVCIERREPPADAISPPLLPTSTLSFTTSGAIVIVSPLAMSPSVATHRSRPVAASTATVRMSSVL
jgi:hypothetical protein